MHEHADEEVLRVVVRFGARVAALVEDVLESEGMEVLRTRTGAW